MAKKGIVEVNMEELFERICPICKKTFKTKFKDKRYCSIDCRKRKHKKDESNYKRICNYCKKDYIAKQRHQKYCSKECSKLKYRNDYNKKMKNNRQLSLRFEIFKRDNFSCQYCGRNYKDDGAKIVIDHIEPKAKGGINNPDNLITSCRECNSGKSDVLLDDHKLMKRKKGN